MVEEKSLNIETVDEKSVNLFLLQLAGNNSLFLYMIFF